MPPTGAARLADILEHTDSPSTYMYKLGPCFRLQTRVLSDLGVQSQILGTPHLISVLTPQICTVTFVLTVINSQTVPGSS